MKAFEMKTMMERRDDIAGACLECSPNQMQAKKKSSDIMRASHLVIEKDARRS
jgi:hypothetical protein